MRTRLIELPDSKVANLTISRRPKPARPPSNGLSAWVKPCARQVFLRHVSAVDDNTATARQLSPSPQTHASSCQETVVTPDVASIMELPKGSLASLEKRLLGKKDPRSVLPSSFHRDLGRTRHLLTLRFVRLSTGQRKITPGKCADRQSKGLATVTPRSR